MKISIIIPTYNEKNNIDKTLSHLIAQGDSQIIVIDGNSTDRTVEIIRRYPVILHQTPKGRANQLNAGAYLAEGDVFVFLHADCMLDRSSFNEIKRCIARGYIGGCLTQRIDAPGVLFRMIEYSGTVRAKLLRIFYGDQAIFVRRDVFHHLGGFDDIELFDDVLFSKKLKKSGKTCILNSMVTTSARRWNKQGILKTSFLNWFISLGFLLGIAPSILKKLYADLR